MSPSGSGARGARGGGGCSLAQTHGAVPTPLPRIPPSLGRPRWMRRRLSPCPTLSTCCPTSAAPQRPAMPQVRSCPPRGVPPLCACSVPPTRSLCDCSSVHAEHDVPAASLLGSGDTWGSHLPSVTPPSVAAHPHDPAGWHPACCPPPSQPLHLSRCQPGDWETSMLD